MPTKLVMLFEQLGNGWSESHCLGSVPTDFEAERIIAERLIPKRLACSGKQTILQFWKLIDISQPRRFRLFEEYPVLQGDTSHFSDAPDTAALAKGRDADFNHTQFFVRGIWDDAVQDGGILQPVWWGVGGPYRAYAQQLQSDSWGWMGRDRLSKKVAIPVAITQNADWTVAITMPAGFFGAGPFPFRTQVRFAGLVGAVILNGQVTVVVTDATHAQSMNRIPIVPWAANTGRLTFNSSVFHAYAVPPSAERVVERKIGRPSYHSAGKRRTRKLG